MKEWKDRFNQSQTQAAKLAGHQNPNQKIHHLQMLKEENGKLCEVYQSVKFTGTPLRKSLMSALDPVNFDPLVAKEIMF